MLSPISPKEELVFVSDNEPGIRRRRAGKGFSYVRPDGTRVVDADTRARIRSLAIPPAYENVWICVLPNGHIQATGRDSRNRKQYRYHPLWRLKRDEEKFGDLLSFAEALPRLRRRIAKDLHGEAGELDFTLAALAALIDSAALRVGNASYARENGTFGAATLLKRHVRLDEEAVRFRYRSKGNKEVRHQVRGRRLHQILGKVADLPGRQLFVWMDETGSVRPVDSGSLNAYLRQAAGEERISAKTFRTWAATLAAFDAGLAAVAADKPVSVDLLCRAAAGVLHNTPAVCRKSYVHPAVIALSDLEDEQCRELVRRLGEIPSNGLRANENRLFWYLSQAH